MIDHGQNETKREVPLYPHRKNLLESLRGQHLDRMVEVGVLDGDWSEYLCIEFQPLELHLVDPWIYQPHLNADLTNVDDDIQDLRYLAVSRRFREALGVKVHRMTGVDFVRSDWMPKQIDFVYLDGDHTYGTVLQELTLFAEHLRRGGHIMLDDYITGQYYGVIPAVQSFLQQHKDFSIIGISEASNSNVLLRKEW